MVTYYSQWTMSHKINMQDVHFGQIVSLGVTLTVSTLNGLDPAPGCDTGNMTWVITGGTCANNALELTTNSAQEPSAILQVMPEGVDTTNFYITLQTNISNTPGAFARIVNYTSLTLCHGQGLDIRADGAFRDVLVGCEALNGCAVCVGGWTLRGSPMSSVITQLQYQEDSYGTYSIVMTTTSGEYEEGGLGYAPNYLGISVGGTDGGVVSVSNVEFDTPIPAITQYWVAPIPSQNPLAAFMRQSNWWK